MGNTWVIFALTSKGIVTKMVCNEFRTVKDVFN